MSEKLCALRKIGGGMSEITITLDGNSGHGSGSNVGAGSLDLLNPHPFSTITLIAKTGTWGSNSITIGGVNKGALVLNSPYDIKGKTFHLAIYNGGSGTYSSAKGTFVLK